MSFPLHPTWNMLYQPDLLILVSITWLSSRLSGFATAQLLLFPPHCPLHREVTVLRPHLRCGEPRSTSLREEYLIWKLFGIPLNGRFVFYLYQYVFIRNLFYTPSYKPTLLYVLAQNVPTFGYRELSQLISLCI